MRLILPAALAAAIALPAIAAPTPVVVQLKGPAGEDLGTATLSEGPKGVVMRVEAKGLTPGWHGLHFHEKGDCSSSDFKSSGGHVHDMATMVHGLLNPDMNETGDLPNIHAGADGTASADIFSPFVSLTGADGRSKLTDSDGSAIVIHAQADDYMAQPIGGAGGRVACGVIAGG